MLIISGILTEQLLTVLEYCWIPRFAFWSHAAQENASTCGNSQAFLLQFFFFFSFSLFSPYTNNLLVALTPKHYLCCYGSVTHVSIWAWGWKHRKSFLYFCFFEGEAVELWRRLRRRTDKSVKCEVYVLCEFNYLKVWGHMLKML